LLSKTFFSRLEAQLGADNTVRLADAFLVALNAEKRPTNPAKRFTTGWWKNAKKKRPLLPAATN
jgi:hypothetical protein